MRNVMSSELRKEIAIRFLPKWCNGDITDWIRDDFRYRVNNNRVELLGRIEGMN